MNWRATKTYFNSPWTLQDERQARRRCPYCDRNFLVFMVNDVESSDVCVSCCMTLSRRNVAPALPAKPKTGIVSQARESQGN